MRRFDPDTVENGHIYPSVKEDQGSIHILALYLDIFCLLD